MGRDLFLVFVGFPVLLSGEETFFLAFVGISGSIVWGRGLFFLVFVGFPVALYRKSPFFPGVCWISGSAVWGRDLFPGICGEFVGGAILEEAFFPWYLWHSAFVAFGVFGIRLIRYRRGPPVVRNMPSVRKTAFYGTEWIFGAQNSLLWYATHFHQGALGVKNRLLWYGNDIRYRRGPPVVRGAFSGAPGARRSPSVFLRAKGRK